MAINCLNDSTHRYYTVPISSDWDYGTTKKFTIIASTFSGGTNTSRSGVIATSPFTGNDGWAIRFNSKNSFSAILGSHGKGGTFFNNFLEKLVPVITVYSCDGITATSGSVYGASLPYGDIGPQTITDEGFSTANATFKADIAPLLVGAQYNSSYNVIEPCRTGISWVALFNNIAMNQDDIRKIMNNEVFVLDDLSPTNFWDFSTPDATITDKVNSRVATRVGTGWGSDLPDCLPYSRTQGGRGININLSKNDKSGRGNVSGVQAIITPVNGSGILLHGLSRTYSGMNVVDGVFKAPYSDMYESDEVHLVLYKSSEASPEDDLIFSGRAPVVSDIDNV